MKVLLAAGKGFVSYLSLLAALITRPSAGFHRPQGHLFLKDGRSSVSAHSHFRSDLKIAPLDVVQSPDDEPQSVFDLLAAELEGNSGSDAKELSTPPSFSKVKWKKKRFALIKDVNAAVEKRNPLAADKAGRLVSRMWKLYKETGVEETRPDLTVYNLWIHAVAKSGNASSERRGRDNQQTAVGPFAESILREMEDSGISPNVVTYTSVMDAYANQARYDPEAPAAAERLLFELLEKGETSPDLQIASAVTGDVVLNAWAQQGTWEGALRAQQILERMEALTTDEESSKSENNIRPTSHSYATVISAWANSRSGRHAALKAQAVLNRLLERDRSVTASDATRPDTVIFNAVLDAWAKSGDPQCGSKAMALLRQMQYLCSKDGEDFDCAPDVVTFNSILSAWSHSGHINAAHQAEGVLKAMIKQHEENPEICPAPNVISYNSVLHAWSQSKLDGAAERSEALLEYMNRQGGLVPDVYSFSSVLAAIAKSKLPNKAVRASNLLKIMLEQAIEQGTTAQLTPVPFNAVLNAAAFSAFGSSKEEQRDAIQVAVRTFIQLRESNDVAPDSISYGNLLKSFANLVPSGKIRSDMTLPIFLDCVEEGKVGPLAWKEVRRALPARVLSSRFGLRSPIQKLEWSDLPTTWRCNTPEYQHARRESVQSKRKKKRQKEDRRIDEQQKPSPLRRVRAGSEMSYQSGRDL